MFKKYKTCSYHVFFIKRTKKFFWSQKLFTVKHDDKDKTFKMLMLRVKVKGYRLKAKRKTFEILEFLEFLQFLQFLKILKLRNFWKFRTIKVFRKFRNLGK